MSAVNNISIHFSASDSEKARFESELHEAIELVKTWWGATFEKHIRVVVVDRASGPSMALLAAWSGQRGYMEFVLATVLRKQAAIIHEVTHVFAPNGNRLLAEGLACYAHELLGGAPAFPNFGSHLHKLAGIVARPNLIVRLDAFPTPVRLSHPELNERNLYVAAGSFVRFLIEQFGLDQFRRLYALTPLKPGERIPGDLERWNIIYDKPVTALEALWIAFLQEDH